MGKDRGEDGWRVEGGGWRGERRVEERTEA
eukprot:COSAG05_NODE_7214_length_842_cov_0.971736_1_plen_29_part_10